MVRNLHGPLVAASIWLVAGGGAAHAFCRTHTGAQSGARECETEGSPLFWRNACRGLYLNPDGIEAAQLDATEASLQRAMAQWSHARCNAEATAHASLRIDYLGRTGDSQVGFQNSAANRNVILFRDERWPYADAGQVALTTVSFRTDTGEILDADMELNATLALRNDAQLARDEFDLHTVFAHELGHFLGLAHSEVGAATMFPTYLPGTTAQGQLKDDDRHGVCAIYLPNGARSTATGERAAQACDVDAPAGVDEPEGGCAAAPGASSWQGGTGLVLACVLGLRRRRRPLRTH